MNLTRTIKKAYDDVFETYNVIVMPTLPTKPRKIPTEEEAKSHKGRLMLIEMLLQSLLVICDEVDITYDQYKFLKNHVCTILFQIIMSHINHRKSHVLHSCTRY